MKTLNELAERETRLFKQRQSLTFLHAAVNLMASDYKLSEVVRILREHADQIEELQ